MGDAAGKLAQCPQALLAPDHRLGLPDVVQGLLELEVRFQKLLLCELTLGHLQLQGAIRLADLFLGLGGGPKQLGVLDGLGAAPCEIAGQRAVSIRVAAPRILGVQQRQCTQALAMRNQRHDQVRARPEPLQDLQVMLIPGDGADFLLGDGGLHLGLAGADSNGDATRLVQADREAFEGLVQQRLLGRIGVRRRDSLNVAVRIEQVNRAPVSQLGHGQMGDVGQRRVVVERFAQPLARLRQELQARGCALALGPLASHRLVHMLQLSCALLDSVV